MTSGFRYAIAFSAPSSGDITGVLMFEGHQVRHSRQSPNSAVKIYIFTLFSFA
jgi:hypothetical protein